MTKTVTDVPKWMKRIYQLRSLFLGWGVCLSNPRTMENCQRAILTLWTNSHLVEESNDKPPLYHCSEKTEMEPEWRNPTFLFVICWVSSKEVVKCTILNRDHHDCDGEGSRGCSGGSGDSGCDVCKWRQAWKFRENEVNRSHCHLIRVILILSTSERRN